MSSVDSWQAEQNAREICARHGYELIRVLPNRSNAEFVAQAKNDRGADLLIKKASGVRRAAREARANQRWSNVGAATFSRELEPGVLIREFAHGVLLKELPCVGARYGVEVGELLARMHSVKVEGDGYPFLRARDYINERWEKQRRHRLPRDHYRVARGACDFLLHEADLGRELAHGDFSGCNIMVADRKLYAFDARGFIGGGALDLVNFVMHVPGADPIQLMRDVVKGYGSTLPTLSAVFAWRVTISAAKGRITAHRQLAERIARAGSHRAIDDLLEGREPGSDHRSRSGAPYRPFAQDVAPTPRPYRDDEFARERRAAGRRG